VLRLRLLGHVSLETPSGPISGQATQRRQLALLALLGAGDEGGLSRDKVQALLWPESATESARHSLADAVYRLRKTLGRACVLAEGESLKLNPDLFDVDVRRFRAALARREVQDAVRVYRGPFLDGFHLLGSHGFEEWREEQARSLARGFEKALQELAERAGSQGRHEEAAELWARLSAHDPLNTRFRVGWMWALAAIGDPGNALQVVEEHIRRLQEELGAEPPSELQALFEDLKSGRGVGRGSAPPGHRTGSRTLLPMGAVGPGRRPVSRPVFVGRQVELTRLRGFLDRALNGEGRVAFVTGESGTGKTALAGEFAREAAEAVTDLAVATGSGNAYTSAGDPYLPFREILGLLTGDVQDRLAGGSLHRDHALRLWDLIPISVAALLEVGTDLIGTLVHRERLQARVTDWAVHGSLSPGSLAQRLESLHNPWQQPVQGALIHQFASTILKISGARPLLLILDDIQWADSGSIDLLFQLGRQVKGSRVLILGLFRPSEVAAGRHGARHPLEPVVNELRRTYGDVEVCLEEAGERSLVEALLDSEPNVLGKEFRDTLFRQTQGHALFTVELIRAMKDQGLLVKDEEGQWTTRGPLRRNLLPAKVEAVIAERVGRLPRELQRALFVASVDGEHFCLEAVAKVLGFKEGDSVWVMADELEKVHGLIEIQDVRREGEGIRSYCRFGHILFQRFLYNRMSEGERANTHRLLGEALEILHGEGRGEISLQLARHFSEAGLPGRALSYQEISGTRARDMGAFTEAAAHFEAALETVRGLPAGGERDGRELELWLNLAWARTQGALGGQEEATNRAHHLAIRVGSTEQRFWSVVQRYWTYAHYRGDKRMGRELTRAALSLAEETGDESLVVHASALVATNAQLRGDFSAALDAFQKVARVYDPARHRNRRYAAAHDPGVLAIGDIGLTLWFLGYPDQARDRCEEAIDLAGEVPSGSTLLFAHMYLGWVLLWRRDYRESRKAFRAARQKAEELGLLSYVSNFADIYSGWCAAREGDVARGMELLARGVDGQRAVGWNAWLSYANALLADTLRMDGRPEEGLILWEEAHRIAPATEELQHEAELLRIKGDLLLALPEPRPHEAEEAFREAVRVARAQESKSYELRATTSLARLLQGTGRRTEAQPILRGVYDWFEEGFDTLDLLEAHELLKEIESEG
jgi:DNA-binding SARP family transcriptional activator